MPIRTFELIRTDDETGISGAGKVLEGTVFSDGECVVRWIAPTSPGHSTTIFHSFGLFMSIHVAPHPDNKTKIIFSDGEVYEHTEKVEEQTPIEPPKRRPRRKKEAATNGK
jgi:hypothetical protein